MVALVLSPKKETEAPIEIRCPRKDCRCSPNGKLLVRFYKLPPEALNRGMEIEVACPLKRSRLVRIKL